MILVDRKNDSQNVSKLHMKHARKFVANVCSVYSVVFSCSRLIFIQCWIVFAASTSTGKDQKQRFIMLRLNRNFWSCRG